jgi:hypothetical protein
MGHKDKDQRSDDIETFRFELAEELGLIEQAGGLRRSRATVLKPGKSFCLHKKKRDHKDLSNP